MNISSEPSLYFNVGLRRHLLVAAGCKLCSLFSVGAKQIYKEITSTEEPQGRHLGPGFLSLETIEISQGFNGVAIYE